MQSPLFIGLIYSSCALFFILSLSPLKRKYRHLREMGAKVDHLESGISRFLEGKKRREIFFQNYLHADSASFFRTLEELDFLRSETADSSGRKPLSPLWDRWREHHLDSSIPGGNTLRFSLEKREATDFVEESSWSQPFPVAIHVGDLRRLLVLVEGVEMRSHRPLLDPPQLIVRSFHIEEKEVVGKGVYFLEMDIIQRMPFSEDEAAKHPFCSLHPFPRISHRLCGVWESR